MDMTENNSTDIYVLVGTYTERLSFVAGKADGIYVYRLDLASGALTYVATAAGTINPSFLALSPAADRLYAVNELTEELGPSGMVSAFAIDPTTKRLTYLNQQSTHGFAPCYVSVDGSGRYAFVANYLTGNVCVLPIGDDGSLGAATDVVQHQGSGPNARQEGPHAHSITPDPENRCLYALDLGIDKIMIYRLDPSRGKLLPADPPWVQVSPGSGPRHLAFHPHGGFAYAINELNSTITAFAYDDATGALQERGTVSTLPADFAEPNTCADIHVAPSGRFVYGSNRGHDSIAIFAVDPETGELLVVGHEPTQGANPRNFAIEPTGGFLLAANQDSDTIVSFRIDGATGELTPTGHVTEVPTPVCLRML
jgi:6-phosphogluconolactonase